MTARTMRATMPGGTAGHLPRRLTLALLCGVGVSCAAEEPPADLPLVRVTDQVYSAIGETLPPSYENGGHNNNLSFIIGEDAVLVVNGGDSSRLAQRLHQSIRQLTAAPVRWVVDENGQGHSFLGNGYWRNQGATIVAHAEASAEMERHGNGALQAMLERNREKGAGTYVAVPDVTFESSMSLDVGGVAVELISFGAAHSPGDISVWLPESRVLIAGDIAFHERLLGVFPDTDVRAWLRSFEAMAALEPRVIVPGHGGPTDLATITTYTYDYLKFLVHEVTRILESDGDLSDAYALDQSAYAHLDTFEELAAKNAGRVYQQLEMDFF